MIRSYTELSRIPTYEGRFDYLMLKGTVGEATFGFDRWMNQAFYRSREWRQKRHEIIVRDLGCDLGVVDHEIHSRIIIHHMNPMSVEALVHGDPDVLNPEYLISTTHATHNAIHYGDASLLPPKYVERRPGDTALWGPRRRTA